MSDVRMMHDDISVGMKGLKSFVSDRMTQVLLLLLVSLLDGVYNCCWFCDTTA